jgi:hypothetical protein
MEMWRDEIRRNFPIPDVEGVKDYYFSLDGGGRNIITDALRENDVKVMLEIGSFLCGSTIQWLDSKHDL